MMKSIEMLALSCVMVGGLKLGSPRTAHEGQPSIVLSVTGLMNTSPGPLKTQGTTEPEEHDPLILADDFHRESQTRPEAEETTSAPTTSTRITDF